MQWKGEAVRKDQSMEIERLEQERGHCVLNGASQYASVLTVSLACLSASFS